MFGLTLVRKVENVSKSENTLYVGFSRRNSLIGRLIRWFTASKVDHTFLLYRSLNLGWMTVGANREAVDDLPLGVFEKSREIVLLARPVEGSLWKNFRLVRDDLGEKYNLMGVVGMGLVEVMKHYFHLRVTNPLSVKGELFCSQFIVRLLRADRWQNLLYGRPASTIDPGELMQWIRLNKDFECLKRGQVIQ